MKRFLFGCVALCVLIGNFIPCANATPIRQNQVRQARQVRQNPRLVSNRQFNDIQSYLAARDYKGLRAAINSGLNLNTQNGYGDTSLCVAVKRSDYVSFNMLKSLGADVGSPCMSKIELEARETFVSSFLARGGYLSLAEQDEMLSSDVNWLLWGSVGGGVAVTAGVVALAAGGGGGGGSSGSVQTPAPSPKPEPKPEPEPSPSVNNPNYYLTPEFSGEAFPGASDFLSQVNAHYAYAYAAENNKAVAGEGVSVAVIDSAFDVNHLDLKDNIQKDASGNVVGRNFQYGPCRGTDTSHCWKQTAEGLVLYGENETDVRAEYAKDEEGYDSAVSLYLTYAAKFPVNWDWDAHQDDVFVSYPLSQDGFYHGTHVAGIVAGVKNDVGMHGIAYNAKLIPIQLSGVADDFFLPYNVVYEAFKFAVDSGARVLNNSWQNAVTLEEDLPLLNGTPLFADIYEYNAALFDYAFLPIGYAIDYAASNDAVTVFAGGNMGSAHSVQLVAAAPIANPSLLFYRDENKVLQPFDAFPTDVSKIDSSLFVTVVSVDEQSKLTSYSQRCGSAAPWCIAAPGGDMTSSSSGGIVSTIPDDYYAMAQGTSMAAPVVSGALATIMAAFPSLKAEEAVVIMFETATDLGAVGTDELYGRGLLNLKAAMQPVGTTSLALGDSTNQDLINVNSSRLTVPKNFAQSLLKQLPQTVMMLDKYKRGFNMPISTLVRSNHRSKQAFADDLRQFTKPRQVQKVQPSERFSMSFSQVQDTFSSDDLAGVNFNMTYHSGDKMQFGFSFTQNAKQSADTYFDQSLRNPFTTSASDVYALSNRFQFAKNWVLGLEVATGKNNFFDGNERLDYRDESAMQTGTAMLTYTPFEKTALSFSAGILNEQNATLGLNGGGAFETADSKTYFMGAELSATPIKNLRLSASYFYGSSKGKDKADVLMRLSDVQSESFGLKATYQLTPETMLGVSGLSPLYIRKATAHFDLPVGRDAYDDVVYRKRVNADLKSDAREWDVGVFATHRAGDWTFQTQAMTRFNPEHQSNVKNDYRLMFSIGFGY